MRNKYPRFGSGHVDMYEPGTARERSVGLAMSDGDHMTRGIALTDSACYCLMSRLSDH
jgi:hypothetical protein